ncbi:hypothetical protein [Agrococcus terreus]
MNDELRTVMEQAGLSPERIRAVKRTGDGYLVQVHVPDADPKP